ncbi:hypothetical protein O3P69_008727 [Scylla paramamosain]|uniref:Uncharacterized protein n=1 Tax=Scylla paramamosain TaxID=85552 RepID=A0AAW0SM44_SCYPA
MRRALIQRSKGLTNTTRAAAIGRGWMDSIVVAAMRLTLALLLPAAAVISFATSQADMNNSGKDSGVQSFISEKNEGEWRLEGSEDQEQRRDAESDRHHTLSDTHGERLRRGVKGGRDEEENDDKNERRDDVRDKTKQRKRGGRRKRKRTGVKKERTGRKPKKASEQEKEKAGIMKLQNKDKTGDYYHDDSMNVTVIARARNNDGSTLPPLVVMDPCGTSTTLSYGESIVFFSTNDGSKIKKCKATVKSPTGTSLFVSFPQFNLNPNGCDSEKILLKARGKKLILCSLDTPSGDLFESNSLKVIYKRARLGNRDCSGGFLCVIRVVGGD